jgi:hypothetical protein
METNAQSLLALTVEALEARTKEQIPQVLEACEKAARAGDYAIVQHTGHGGRYWFTDATTVALTARGLTFKREADRAYTRISWEERKRPWWKFF